MKRRESIASQLSTTVTLIMVCTVILIGAAVYWRANRLVSAEVGHSAFSQLEMVGAEIDEQARKTMRVAHEASQEIVQVLSAQEEPDATQLCQALQQVAAGHPELQECTLALQDYGRYSTLPEDTVAQGSDFRKELWYTAARDAGQGVWVDPVSENHGSCHYSLPLYTEDSLFLGVLSLNRGTGWIDTIANRIHIFEHSYPLVLASNGNCLNHPDIKILLYDGHPDHSMRTQVEVQTQVGEQAIYRKKGSCKVKTLDFRASAFFLPVESTGWELAVVSPFTDAYAGLESFLFFSLLIVLLFSIVLIAVVNAVIAKATAPLSEFARMARKVAVGEFDAQLPEKGHRSEMADLYDSFGFMQKSLAKNIEELKKSAAEQERMESEFHLARKIQLDLVPNIFPAFPDRKDIDIHAVMNPWREVGGNLYNFGIVDNNLLFCIGDVAGKGMMAAIFMSTTFKLIHSSFYNHATPAEALSFANKTMAQGNESDMFVTLFFGALDLETGRLTYCSAGQDEPMLVSPDGEVKPLEINPNVPVGLMPETEYEEQTITLQPGSMLVLYTDGVVEAQNRSGDLYGTDRLMRRLKEHSTDSCEGTVAAIREDVRQFAHNETQDDCTALAIRWR